ncbi:hypothetical protein TraAM80_08494 [Trypanosoma rangeli]|uniref:Uncharacterized protein n=1 Tax=Trypanosoma rangeli TaxID=5698 RepID=A0A422N0F7_TRYRA|nr:uncharacterized protein TraAM80_08494 [Trypanosoma rangeli]RNE98943.1 hypothetical protein TraAM80_08494 [Trypanosoma rangeli]|eukprot:RNE98943.1 hypothetical protein TraAM80_08494 [Trypanosoma rangeli]
MPPRNTWKRRWTLPWLSQPQLRPVPLIMRRVYWRSGQSLNWRPGAITRRLSTPMATSGSCSHCSGVHVCVRGGRVALCLASASSAPHCGVLEMRCEVAAKEEDMKAHIHATQPRNKAWDVVRKKKIKIKKN